VDEPWHYKGEHTTQQPQPGTSAIAGGLNIRLKDGIKDIPNNPIDNCRKVSKRSIVSVF
jgi:hypothetical protein